MCEQQLSDMTKDQLFEKFLDELFISKDSPITKDCVNEIKTRLQSAARWVPVSERNPELTDECRGEYCENRWTGNDYEPFMCKFWCEIEFEKSIFFDYAFFDFETNKWTVTNGESVIIEATVKRWTYLPEPPQG